MYYGPSGHCLEKCGDGLNFGINECDDGNTDSGDGCSPECKKEEGWICSGGNSTTKDKCSPIKTQIYNLTTTEMNMIIVEFEKDVTILGELTPEDLIFEISLVSITKLNLFTTRTTKLNAT